jgi:predicted metal-dependent hydrolase
MTDLQKHQEWLLGELARIDAKIAAEPILDEHYLLLIERVALQRAYNNTLKIQMNYGYPKEKS